MPDHLPHEKAPNSLKLRAFADRTVSSHLTQTPLKPSKSSDIKELQLYFSYNNSHKGG